MVQPHPVTKSQLANKGFGLNKIALLWEFPSLLTVLFGLGQSTGSPSTMAILVKKPPNWLASHDTHVKTHMIQDLLYPSQSDPQGPKVWSDPIWNAKQGS